jgi:nucleotide-binding universal stress UspA family protein
VPTDFSECSRQALRYAVPLAREFDASIYLLFVVQVNYPSAEVIDVNLPKLEAELREQGERQLRTLLERDIGGQVPAQAVVRTGQPMDEILHAAETLDIDLIILSTHGRTGLAHVFLGSTAEKVVRHARCPVFIVREKEHEFVPPLRTRLYERETESPALPHHD